MADRTILALLEKEARDTRTYTDELLARIPEEWLYRRVDWTDCTLGWHIGHIAVGIEDYAVPYLAMQRWLPEGWQELFGYGSQPLPRERYPQAGALRAAHDDGQARLMARLAELSDADLPALVDAEKPDFSRLNGILGIIGHEAMHFASIETLLLHFERQQERVAG